MLHYKALARTTRAKVADIALMIFGMAAAFYTTIQTIAVRFNFRIKPSCFVLMKISFTSSWLLQTVAANRSSEIAIYHHRSYQHLRGRSHKRIAVRRIVLDEYKSINVARFYMQPYNVFCRGFAFSSVAKWIQILHNIGVSM